MKMFIGIIGFLIIHLVYSQDVCNTVNCGSGVCLLTQNPSLPYFCRCPSGSNTILPCPSENPCSRKPCGQGTCEVVPSLVHGYLCRCAGDTISLTSCNVTRNGCYPNPCVNGLCIEGLTSYYCNCLPNWTGRLCDEKLVSPCSKSPCSPGKCFQLNDPTIPYVCLCPNGQFGLSCRNTLTSTPRILTTSTTTTTRTTMPARSLSICNPYGSESCKNGGQCLQAGENYRCLCNPGYTGLFCELNINECASNPCLHGGICYDLQASYICFCPDGRFRPQCVPRAGFSGTTSTARTLSCPCQHGGVCATPGLDVCSCASGYTGRLCESVLPTVGCNSIQCGNGGTCLENGPGSSALAACVCKSGYTGKFCEIEYFRCRANGRFIDTYNCEKGKYFECIHYQGTGSNPYGMLLSRSCPASLLYNLDGDRCDYPQNVKCVYPEDIK